LLERTDKFLELDITLVPTEVENYIIRAEEFDHSAWIKSGAPSGPVVTADQVANPQDGAVNADQIAFPATGVGELNSIMQDADTRVPELANRKFIWSVFMRADSTFTIQIRIHDGPGFVLKTVNILTSWQRFSLEKVIDASPTQLVVQIMQIANQSAKTLFAWGGMLGYDVLGPYVKTQGAIPAAIDRWDAFITAVLDGTSFDYYPDAFAAGFTTYVLEDKVWRPKLQVRGALGPQRDVAAQGLCAVFKIQKADLAGQGLDDRLERLALRFRSACLGGQIGRCAGTCRRTGTRTGRCRGLVHAIAINLRGRGQTGLVAHRPNSRAAAIDRQIRQQVGVPLGGIKIRMAAFDLGQFLFAGQPVLLQRQIPIGLLEDRLPLGEEAQVEGRHALGDGWSRSGTCQRKADHREGKPGPHALSRPPPASRNRTPCRAV
ncbi:hypothetical protein LCGC14_2581280, partial [marine sediment metagenome]